jgi:TolB-like protein
VDFEIGLNTAVARLREALSDSAEKPLYIETIPRRGYRFIAETLPVAPAASTRKPRVVILPLLNLTGDAAQEYFSDAMTDDIITALCSLGRNRFAVIARTTAMHYKTSRKDIARIARELNLDYLVEAAVRRSNDYVDINVQLIQACDQTHLFARKYTDTIDNLFNLHKRVAEDISTAIAGPLSACSVVYSRQPTQDSTAYQLYLRGRFQMYLETPESLTNAKLQFEQAIARDPEFALAYVALGELYFWTGFFGYRKPKEAFSAALWPILRALEIDNSLGETHAFLGKLRQVLDFDWPEVRRECARALDLSPSSVVVRFCCATSAPLPMGELDQCIAQLQQALELDPLSALLNIWLCIALWLARDYERALQAVRMYGEILPQSYLVPMMIGMIYRDSGRVEDAIAFHQQSVQLSGGAPQPLAWLGLSLAKAGRSEEARATAAKLHDMSTRSYVSPTCFAWIHVGLNEIDEAFRWMDRAIEERDPNMMPIRTFPFLDPLRSDSRFPALLRKMNLT